MRRLGATLALLVLPVVPPPATAADDLAVDTRVVPSPAVVRVPVRVRDLAGTTLDEGDGPDLEVQSFAFQVTFPDAFVDASNFFQAGVTAGRVAFFSQVTPGASSIYVLKAFDETTNPLAFTLNAPAPGDVIGEIEISIAPATPSGTTIPLELLASNAALVNDSATLSETVANAQLVLRAGFIFVGSDVILADGFE